MMARAPGLRSAVRAVTVCCLAAIFAVLGTRYLRLFNDAATTIEDLQTSLMEPLPQDDRIVVMRVTEAVLAEFPYRSPINRNYLANTIDTLFRKGARLVALDIIIDQPTEPALDRHLRQVIREHANAIVVAVGDSESQLDARQQQYQADFLAGIETGFADIPTRDGVARTVYAGRADDPAGKPSFVSAIATKLGYEAPVADARLHFQRPADGGDPIRTFEARPDFLANYPNEWFAGRIVFIGVDLPGTDRFQTPLAVIGEEFSTIPGVLVHAQALAQLMDGREYPAPGATIVLVILALAVTAGYLLPLASVPIALQALAGVCALTLYWALAFGLSSNASMMIPVVEPTLGFIASATLSAAYGYRRVARQKRFLNDAFRRYVSPSVIEEVVSHPEKLTLGGEKRELSFIFCDLAGFTSLSERLDPELVVTKLQGYFDGLLRIALRHDGTIDRLVGDGVAVLFGAPVARADHAERAVACALEIDGFCEGFRRSQNEQGIDWGATRIGVHSGVAVVGNAGSSERFHYTAHGDCVNTAARLEGANRLLGTRVCISRITARRFPDFEFRPVGELVLEGKRDAVECVTDRGTLSDSQLQHYLRAYTLLQEGSADAVEMFATLHEQVPFDGPTTLHLNRSRAGLLDTRIVMTEK